MFNASLTVCFLELVSSLPSAINFPRVQKSTHYKTMTSELVLFIHIKVVNGFFFSCLCKYRYLIGHFRLHRESAMNLAAVEINSLTIKIDRTNRTVTEEMKENQVQLVLKNLSWVKNGNSLKYFVNERLLILTVHFFRVRCFASVANLKPWLFPFELWNFFLFN